MSRLSASMTILAAWYSFAMAQGSAPHVLGLRGAPNFRDLGGYATSDGRHVRRGMVYRSNALSSLTVADRIRVDRLQIVSEVDLRTQQERAAGPDLWLHPPADIYASPKASLAPLVGPMLAHVKDKQTARAWLQGFYARMPDAYRIEYANLFRRLAAGQEPLLIHCTAGKDRTGVASAILLSVLGVPRDIIVADYTLTDRLLPPPPRSAATGSLAALPEDARMELWRAEDSSIIAALQAIDEEYGSVDFYLKSGLGLSDTQIRQIKSRLTD